MLYSASIFEILLNGTLGLVVGLTSIPILAWLTVGLIYVAFLLWSLLIFLKGLWDVVGAWVNGILQGIGNFLQPIISFLWPVVLILSLVGLLIGIAVLLIRQLKVFGVVIVLLLAVGVYLGWPSLTTFYQNTGVPILQGLGGALGVFLGWLWAGLAFVIVWALIILFWLSIVFAILGVTLGVLGTLGSTLVDQIRSAWHSGTGHRGILLGAFSIGLAISLLLWASSTSGTGAIVDGAWHVHSFLLRDVSPTQTLIALLPQGVRDASSVIFGSASPPMFDFLLLALVLPLSFIGIMRGLSVRHADGFRTSFIRRDIMLVMAALLFAIPVLLSTIIGVNLPHDDT